MRTFLSIELPDEVKEEIYRIRGIAMKKGLFLGKFVEKQNLHLTLKFFGEVSDEQVEEIKQKLGRIKFSRFKCRLGGLGFFGERIFWIELVAPAIKELHDLIDNELGFEKDTRFHNHITIARIKQIKNRIKVKNFVSEIKVEPLKFEVNEFVLKNSQLNTNGPVYSDVERFGLE